MMDPLPNPFCSFMSGHIESLFVKRRLSGSFALVLLSGDVALNPGPLKFGFANCRSIRNKGPILCGEIQTGNFDVFGLTETHIKALDTPSFLNELTPEDFSLVHTNRETNVVAVLAFLLNLLLILKPFIPLSSRPMKMTLSVSLSMGVTCFLGSFTGPLPHL